MGYDLPTWLNLALRWLHLTAGIAWIGASFYFIWLDNSLTPPATPRDGVKGELWAVHGGGFYHSQKYLNAPPHLPDHLHWFKWEAYTTWISGFLLLCVIYYWAAPVYLIDRSKVDFSQAQAIVVGLGFIFGGLAVYEGLCRSPLGARPRLFGLTWFAVLTAAAYALTHIFSDRGAFMHLGAIVGTAMVANVFLVIIPNQAKIVEAMRAGRQVDPRLGAMGKQRSVHNNYMTLPVLFIMISNHYPIVTGHPLAWLLLAMLSAAGVSIRHFFNLKHVGIVRHDFLFYGFMLAFAASIVATEVRPAAAPGQGPVAFSTVNVLVQKHCVTCHSLIPTHRGFTAPPANLVLDTPEHIAQAAPRIYERAVASTSMPLGNETGMTATERAQLGAWIKAGAKTQ
jgi:uncharacterized membrane protein